MVLRAAEIHALLTMQHLLANLDPGGLLAPHIQPLIARLNALLGGPRKTRPRRSVAAS